MKDKGSNPFGSTTLKQKQIARLKKQVEGLQIRVKRVKNPLSARTGWMMGYALFDLTESLDRVDINEHDVRQVLWAWGENGDLAEWSGGFILRMADGRYCEITGFCDTTGWGCQDGANVVYYDADPGKPEDVEDADPNPADLNLYFQKLAKEFVHTTYS